MKKDDYESNRVIITPEMLSRSKKKADACGCMNSKSFEKGGGNLVGFLGEEIVYDFLGKRFCLIKEDEYTHDFSCIIDGKRLIFDVKSKKTTVPYVDEEFEASIVSYQIDDVIQPVDFYVFCRVYFPPSGEDPPFGWLLGKIKKSDFIKKSRFLKKGEYDSRNDYYVQNDCYNLSYKDLIKFKEPK